MTHDLTDSQFRLLQKIKRRGATRCPLLAEDIAEDETDDAWHMAFEDRKLIIHERSGALSLTPAGEAALAAEGGT